MDFLAKARERAKELAQFDLDAMAEEDDYIHTESLNVSKTTSTTKPPPPAPTTGDQQQQQQSLANSSNFFIRQDSAASSQQSSSTGGYPITPAPSSAAPSSWAPALPDAGGALQHMASSSSWSLLDRKPASRTASGTNINVIGSSSSSIRVEEATARLNALVFDSTTTTTTTTASGDNRTATADAAGEASAHSQRARIMSSTSEASKTLSVMSDDHADNDDDDDASQDSYDENDPILSLLQQQQKPVAKTKNRFMNDLDQRLAQPAVPETVNPLEMEPSNSMNASSSKSMPPPRRLWPWQKPTTRPSATNANSNNNNSSNGDDNDEEAGGILGRPLWARPKKKKPKPPVEEEPFVLVSSGNLGFSEEEKQALASLKQSAKNNQDGDSGNILSDHPRESFVALTLVLGGAVYWFARTTAAADDFAN